MTPHVFNVFRRNSNDRPPSPALSIPDDDKRSRRAEQKRNKWSKKTGLRNLTAADNHVEKRQQAYAKRHDLADSTSTAALRHAEHIRWHDVVLPRLRHYGLAHLPQRKEDAKTREADARITQGRLRNLEREVQYEKDELTETLLPETFYRLMQGWNATASHYEETHLRVALEPERDDLDAVDGRLELEQNVDKVLVREHFFLQNLEAIKGNAERSPPFSPTNSIPPGLCEQALEAASKETNHLALQENYHNLLRGPRPLHDLVDRYDLRQHLPYRTTFASQTAARARYWVLVYTQYLLRRRRDLGRQIAARGERDDGEDPVHEEEEELEKTLREVCIVQSLVKNRFYRDPPSDAAEAHEIFGEIEREVRKLPEVEKRRRFAALPSYLSRVPPAPPRPSSISSFSSLSSFHTAAQDAQSSPPPSPPLSPSTHVLATSRLPEEDEDERDVLAPLPLPFAPHPRVWHTEPRHLSRPSRRAATACSSRPVTLPVSFSPSSRPSPPPTHSHTPVSPLPQSAPRPADDPFSAAAWYRQHPDHPGAPEGRAK